MEKKQQQKHVYTVKFSKTFSRSYTSNGSFYDSDGVENAKFYEQPSQKWKEENGGDEGGGGIHHHDCVKDNSLQNYAYIQRVKNINKPIEKLGHDIPRYNFHGFRQWVETLKRMVAENFRWSDTPEIVCNLSCLVALMSPSQDEGMIATFMARRIILENGQRAIYLKHGFQTKYNRSNDSYGFTLENELASQNGDEDRNSLAQPNGPCNLESDVDCSSEENWRNPTESMVQIAGAKDINGNQSIPAVHNSSGTSSEEENRQNDQVVVQALKYSTVVAGADNNQGNNDGKILHSIGDVKLNPESLNSSTTSSETTIELHNACKMLQAIVEQKRMLGNRNPSTITPSKVEDEQNESHQLLQTFGVDPRYNNLTIHSFTTEYAIVRNEFGEEFYIALQQPTFYDYDPNGIQATLQGAPINPSKFAKVENNYPAYSLDQPTVAAAATATKCPVNWYESFFGETNDQNFLRMIDQVTKIDNRYSPADNLEIQNNNIPQFGVSTSNTTGSGNTQINFTELSRTESKTGIYRIPQVREKAILATPSEICSEQSGYKRKIDAAEFGRILAASLVENGISTDRNPCQSHSCETSSNMVDTVSKCPAKPAKLKNVNDANQILESLYGATVTSPGERDIKIAFIAETDGLWETGWRSKDYKEYDVVEMKSVDKSVLMVKDSSKTEYYFEEYILRKFYSQCRIRGLTSFLCNFVDNKLLKEQWLYDVNKIPEIVQKCSLKSPKQWNRAFPKSLIGGEDQAIKSRKRIKNWTEDDCFRSLFSALQTIRFYFEETDDHKQYFIRDGLTMQNQKKVIEKIDKNEYLETELVKKKLLIRLYKVDRKCEMAAKEQGGQVRIVNDIFSTVGLPIFSSGLIEKETRVIPKNHPAYAGTQTTSLLLEVTFRSEELARFAFRVFRKNKSKCRQLYGGIFISKQRTERQYKI